MQSTKHSHTYNNSTGSPNVTELVFDPSNLTLTCISTGGPATTVTWRKNCAVVEVDGTMYHQSQRVTSYEKATYESTLKISSQNITDYDVPFSCHVTNSRGNSYMNVTVEGTSKHTIKKMF